jgi:hypothetical protein
MSYIPPFLNHTTSFMQLSKRSRIPLFASLSLNLCLEEVDCASALAIAKALCIQQAALLAHSFKTIGDILFNITHKNAKLHAREDTTTSLKIM